jgi:hypothetical protein
MSEPQGTPGQFWPRIRSDLRVKQNYTSRLALNPVVDLHDARRQLFRVLDVGSSKIPVIMCICMCICMCILYVCMWFSWSIIITGSSTNNTWILYATRDSNNDMKDCGLGGQASLKELVSGS